MSDGGLQWWQTQGQEQEWLADKEAQAEYQKWLDSINEQLQITHNERKDHAMEG